MKPVQNFKIKKWSCDIYYYQKFRIDNKTQKLKKTRISVDKFIIITDID